MSPELAADRGIETGTLVRLESPYGAVKLHALVTDRVRGNDLYVPMHSVSHETAVNLLTGGGVDVRTNTPAYKQAKVRLQILNVKGANPLPLDSPRDKKRHPQNGVEVARKWQREGYVSLVD